MLASSKVLAACLMLASQTYAVPPAVLIGIYKTEGGKVGQEVTNTNGTFDMGPMQINSSWLPELAGKWGVTQTTARKWVRDDACTNVGVAAWILKGHMNETQNLAEAIAYYHSRTPSYGGAYKQRVIAQLEKNGLIKTER